MSVRRPGRPSRDVPLAQAVGQRAAARARTIYGSYRRFTTINGFPQSIVAGWKSGRRNLLASPLRGRVALSLLTTLPQLAAPQDHDGFPEATSTESELELVRRRLFTELSNIVDQPLSEISHWNWQACHDPTIHSRAIHACREARVGLGRLVTGREMTRAVPLLSEMIQMADGARKSVDHAAQFIFDARDQRAHFESFVLPDAALDAASHSDRQRLFTMSYHDGQCDPELRLRYLVREADILKICGRREEAFNLIREAFDLAETGHHEVVLTYPAYRTGCFLAATCGHEFGRFVTRTHRALDSGYVQPHDACTILEGLADAYAIAYKRVRRSDYAANALRYYEQAQFLSLAAEKHAGGKHLEHWLRLQMRPLSFADANIPDLIDCHGMAIAERKKEIALGLLGIALETGSTRVAKRLQNFAGTHS